MARVTSAGQADNLKRKINTALENLEKAQMRVSTGLRIQKPSDDPALANKILDIRGHISQNEQFVSNVNHTEAQLSVENMVYQDVQSILGRARDLAQMALSDTNHPSDYKFYAEELKQLVESTLETVNTTFEGKPLFAGNRTEGTAFTAERSQSTVATREFKFARNVSHDKVEIGLEYADSFSVGDELVLKQGENQEYVTVSSVQSSGDSVVIQFNSDLSNNYSVESNQPAVLTKPKVDGEKADIESEDATVAVPLLKSAERRAVVLPLDRVQGALEAGDQIVVQGMGGVSEIALVETVQTDLTKNEAVVLLKTPLQNTYDAGLDARVIKHTSVGIGDIVGISYQGDEGVHLERVGKSSFIEVGMPGDVAFQRVFDQLVDLQAAVRNQGKGAIEELSNAMESSIEHITILQTQVGGKLNRADTLRNRLSDKNLALEQFLETVEQVDYSDAVVEYQIQLNMLTAMLQTGARTMSPSLFNFM